MIYCNENCDFVRQKIFNRSNIFIFYNYQMEFKIFCTVLFLIACLGTANQDISEDNLIQIGQKFTGQIPQTQSNNTVIAIQVKDNVPQGYTFFNLQLPAQDFWKKTKLTVFNDDNELLSCQQSDNQICYIETSKIKPKSLLAIKIQCQRGCSYNLATTVESVIEVEDQEEQLTEQFDESKIKLYKWKIPSLNENQQIQFFVLPADSNNLPERVKIYANTNGQLPSIYNSEFVSIPIWGGGEGLFLNKSKISNKQLLIMIVGKGDNDKFYLSTKINENGEQEVSFGEYFHDYLALGSEHILKLPLPQLYDSIYSLQFVIFEGEIQVGLFTDKQCKNLYKYQPIIYKGSVKYIFSADGIPQLYIKTKSKNSATTYNILLVLESRSNHAKIEDGGFTFATVKDQIYMYTPFEKNDEIKDEGQYLFQIDSIKLKKNNLDITFYLCSSEFIFGCFKHQKLDSKSVVQIDNLEKVQNQKITTFKAKIKSSLINSKKNLRYRKFIFIAQYKNEKKASEAYFGLIIKDLNKVRLLKAKQYIFTTLNLQETKYFLFKNKNLNTNKIQVHFRAIQGVGEVSIYRADPRRNPLTQKKSIQDQYGAFNIIQNFVDPIYIEIRATTQAQFLVNIITFSKEQLQASNKMKVPTFQMKRAEQYTMYLPGLKDQIIMISQKQHQISFSLKSNVRINFCSLYSPQQACEIPQIASILEKKIQKKSIDGNYYLKVINLSPTKKATISVEYKVEAADQCVIHSLGKLYNDVLSHGQCIRFILPPNKDYQGFFMPAQITSIFPGFSICGKPIQTNGSEIKISASDLQNYCQAEKKQAFKYVDMFFKNPLDINKKLKAFYFFQVSGQPLILPEGVSFHDKVSSSPGLLKSYVYQVVNKNITSEIKLDRIQGKTSAFVNIVDLSLDNFPTPSPNNFKFKTQANTIYYFDQQSTISINARHLDQFKCDRCGLLIAIYSDEEELGSLVSYGIEVSQGVTNLNQHEQSHQFLSEGSIKYYKYQCKNGNKTVIFDISDNGLHCAKMNLGLQEYPSQKNHIDFSLDNHLEAQCLNNLVFYVSVEAISDCPVSIMAQSSDFKLIKLTEGIPLGLKLKLGQMNYFTFHHSSKGAFKIISIEEFGNVNFYLNPVTQDILAKITNDSLNHKQKQEIFQNFKIKNSYSNSIELDEKNPNYCDQCLYIGAIEASDAQIDTTIIYLQNNEELIMRASKVLYDELEPKQIQKIVYYDMIAGSLNVDVLSGKIKITMIYGNNSQSQNSRQFASQMKMEYIDYNFSPLIQDSLMAKQQGIHIKIENIGNQIASFAISNFAVQDPVTKALTIKKGIPLTLHMTEETVCAQGFFPSNNQKLYISVDKQFISFLDDLNITVYFNDQARELEGISEFVDNMIMITYESLDGKNYSQNYLVCFSNQAQNISYVELTILQSSKVNIIPPNKWGIYSGSEVFMFHPKNSFGLDILTCKGTSNFSFSQNYNQIISNSVQNHQVDNLRDLTISDQTQESHVLYFDTQDATTFVKIQTGLSIVKWINIDQNTEQGLGYKKFGVGNFDFRSTKNQLILSWGGVTQISETRMKIDKIQYQIYIASSEEQLRSAIHCSVQFPQNFFKSTVNGGEQSKCQISIKKSQIKSKFQQIQVHNSSTNSEQIPNIYIGLAAKAKISVNGTNGYPIADQYKFLYRPIEISEQLVLTDKESSSHAILISIGAIAIISLIGIMIVYILIKKLVPLISRLRARNMLMDEPVGQSSKPSMDTPDTQKEIQNEQI